ncbi:MAG: branched-chain amino acid ABC transporter substrate-binding protein [Nocardioidaceae bacterium]
MTAPVPRPARLLGPLAGVAVAALVLSGCSGGLLGDDEESSADGPIKLGMVAPMSGSSSAIGPYMQNGAQLAVDEINADGGVDGRDLELVVEDGACESSAAASAANKLVTEKVTFSVGGYCSGATLPTLPIFERADIPMIIPAANSNELVDQDLPNVFLINGTGTQQADAALTHIEDEGATNVALMDDNTSYSTDIADLTADLLEESGGPDLAGRESVTPGESDYSANVSAILDTDPDFIYWTGYYQEGGLIIRQLRQSGYDGQIMVADGSVDAKLADIAGVKNAEGVLATMTQTPQTIPGAEDWIKRYQDEFGSEPGPYSTQAYDAVRLSAEAIEQAGSTDSAGLIEALEGIDGFEIFSGPLTFADDHTLSGGGFQILEYKNGNTVLKDAMQ